VKLSLMLPVPAKHHERLQNRWVTQERCNE